MMENPLVSIIMPVYNGEKYLSLSIESVLRQTYSNFELLIINDGSIDNTEKIINSYKKKDSRIRYIKNETNLKLIKTLNKGIELAKGEYISRMDADDIAHPTLLEKEVGILNVFLDVSIVNVYIWYLNDEGTYYRYNTHPELKSNFSYLFISLFENLITHPGVMVRSSELKLFKYADIELVRNFEDKDLWNRMLLANKKIYNIKERLLFYRIAEKSVTRTNSAEVYERLFIHLKQMLLKLNPQLTVSDYVKINFTKKANSYQEILKLNTFYNDIANKYLIGKDLNDFMIWKTTHLIKISKSLLFTNRTSFFIIIAYGLLHFYKVNYKIYILFLKSIFKFRMGLILNKYDNNLI